ncbi:hypothetical protein ES708_19855 [subsurface metagenome]
MSEKKVWFRFYEELNDFLPKNRKKVRFQIECEQKQSVKDAIESLGIPHTEIDLILVNGQSVSFDYHILPDDNISVYPVFESLDISRVTRLRNKPLRIPSFILDVHLGKLAKYLRMTGFDTLYENRLDDNEIVEIALREKRIILTRDIGLLKHKVVTHGYWIRSQKPVEQFTETARRFDLFSKFKPFRRCTVCNGLVKKTRKQSVIHQLKPRTKIYFDEFFKCSSCGKVYWKGSHFERMQKLIFELADVE